MELYSKHSHQSTLYQIIGWWIRIEVLSVANFCSQVFTTKTKFKELYSQWPYLVKLFLLLFLPFLKIIKLTTYETNTNVAGLSKVWRQLMHLNIKRIFGKVYFRPFAKYWFTYLLVFRWRLLQIIPIHILVSHCRCGSSTLRLNFCKFK